MSWGNERLAGARLTPYSGDGVHGIMFIIFYYMNWKKKTISFYVELRSWLICVLLAAAGAALIFVPAIYLLRR